MPGAPQQHPPGFVVKISCPDRKGIVAAVAGFLAERDCNITESGQYGDAAAGRFFLRTVFAPGNPELTCEELESGFAPIAEGFAMEWSIHDCRVNPRVLVLVSKPGHCLNDLLFRVRSGTLPIEIVGIVSNHEIQRPLAEFYGYPYHCFPVDAATREGQETRIEDLVRTLDVDLVVLARYMQVLSPALAGRLAGRCINIHHSFLPGFKGARAYQQAHERGVKLIGATAHYVTADLDGGPIIEQETSRVTHAHSPADFARLGRDLEAIVLARAVRYHVEHRVLIHGNGTVVFR